METVKVRVAVAVDRKGNWRASGWSDENGRTATADPMEIALGGVAEGQASYWIEAELPVPEAKTIKAKLSKEK